MTTFVNRTALENAIEREEHSLERRLSELKEAEQKADGLRWQVMNVESSLKEMRNQLCHWQDHNLTAVIRELHRANDVGLCVECERRYPCGTIAMLDSVPITELTGSNT